MSDSRGSQPSPLPRPRRARWQPLRSGLLNLYRFDHQELWFEEGHLLLRGNNGTGKSRILALQLPFLFDGEVAPHRLEPDGDSAKRIEWNLLMGRYPDRLGYSWLELGRLTDDEDRGEPGTERYLTLGCGLSAVAGRGKVDRWFFITDRRLGQELFLQGSSGEALNRTRLAEALGDRGTIFTTAAQYRAAIDRELFGLGVQRYEALVNLLIQLRQPQLSRRLDEAKLSAALSEALPPLDSQLLADIAEAFRSLEADREALEALESAAKHVDTFLGGYQSYAQIAARRRAEAVRTAHSAYEHSQRRLRASEGLFEEAEHQLEEIVKLLENLGLSAEAAAAEVQTLEARPEMRDKQSLDAAREEFRERQRQVALAVEELRQAEAARGRRANQLVQAQHAAERARSVSEDKLVAAGAAASAAGLASHHERVLGHRALLDADDAAALETPEKEMEELTARQQRAVDHLRQLQRQVEDAEKALAVAKEHQTEREVEVDEAVESHRRALTAREAAADALLEAYGQWQPALAELRPPSVDELADDLREWARELDGESPLVVEVRRAEAEASAHLAGKSAASEERRGRVVAELEGLQNEHRELEAGVHVPPPVPHWRAHGVREEMLGGPLWQLCDFRPEVEAPARAGIEAALEAAGLLDAWITPDGRLLEAGTHDTVLVASAGDPAPAGRGLDQLLVPDLDQADPKAGTVSSSTVLGILRQIGLGVDAGTVWVSEDGRFRNGPLQGAWSKEAAQHIGPRARETERQRRMEELKAAIGVAEASLEEVLRQLQEVEARRKDLLREILEAPGDDGVRAAAAAVEAASNQVKGARGRLIEAERRVTLRRREHGEVLEKRDVEARDLGLFEHLQGLDALADALNVYRRTLASLWPTVASHISQRQAAEAVEADLRRAEEETQRRRLREGETRTLLRRSEARRDTLERTVGVGVQQILTLLDRARAQVAEVRHHLDEGRKQEKDLLVKRASAEQAIEGERRALERESVLRDEAFTALGRLVDAGLARVAAPGFVAEAPTDYLADPEDWSARRAVEIARGLESLLGEVEADDQAWARQQQAVHGHFQTLAETLSGDGYQPMVTVEDTLWVVTAPFQGRQQSLDVFRIALGDEVAARDRVLREREREVIENHLIGEVSLHLHQRLREAEELVQAMNSQVEERPMSTGMTLRFRWQPQLEEVEYLDRVRPLLIAEQGVWSPVERKAVGDFLHHLIRKQQEDGEVGSWHERLIRALDYRAWHRFGVERQQDGRWRRLTRSTHGTGSGGEKAIALTVPQFAAASAFYDTADKRAPRLILLDEAFVGVDADMRAKCMGLLEAFDLDFIMTSEREWGCYPTLPGLAIYQLATRPDIDAVGVTRWQWNGSEKRKEERIPPGAAPPREEEQAGLLFGEP